MSFFERVTKEYSNLKFMTESRARFLRDLMVENDLHDVLEIGFFHGKSSAYFAAIMEDQGQGRLVTIDHRRARKFEPNIKSVLSSLDLSSRVKPIYAERSYTWELKKLIKQEPRPLFDLCYFDGGHIWDLTGFGFFLVDMLLRPGGWIIFDDLNWTIETHLAHHELTPNSPFKNYSEDEQREPAVRLVWELLVPYRGYVNRRVEERFSWGIAQKPPLHEEH